MLPEKKKKKSDASIMDSLQTVSICSGLEPEVREDNQNCQKCEQSY